MEDTILAPIRPGAPKRIPREQLDQLKELVHLATDEEREEIEAIVKAMFRELAEQSLHEFVKQAWSIIEPGAEYIDNWHIEGICLHLEAVTNKLIPKLLINIPPSTGKSILCNVMWPAWTWGPRGWPQARFLHGSYQADLTTRDSLACRMLIESDWYQENWGSQFKLRTDQNRKTRYDNNKTGWRIATSVGGKATGEHPDFIVWDDPHNVKGSESEAKRQDAVDFVFKTLPSRGIARGCSHVGVMQRLHPEDCSGVCLARGGWVHICLPMDFEPNRMEDTPIGWNDPREEDGDLMWPALLNRDKVEELKLDLGPMASQGQLQQDPPDYYDGEEWPKEYFEPRSECPEGVWFQNFPHQEATVAKTMALDPSLGAADTSDFSAIIMLVLDVNGVMWVDASMERRDPFKIVEDAFMFGSIFGPDKFACESNGFQTVLQTLIEEKSRSEGFMLPMWPIHNGKRISKDDRIRRLNPYLARGEFRFRDTEGGRILVQQLKGFPAAKRKKDGPDALEMAVRTTRITWMEKNQKDPSEVERGRVIAG